MVRLKRHLQKLALLASLAMLPQLASAYDFMVDGLCYNYNSDGTSLSVTSGGNYTGDIIIPENVTYDAITYSVTSIGRAAFYYCSGLTSVTIGNSVTSIGDWAFSYCSGLTSVTIPNSVTSIGEVAFGYCTGLTSVTIGNSVTSIGDRAFTYCSGLTSVTIPNSVTSIGECAFLWCTGLTSVTIPNSVTSIGDRAFYGTPWYNNQPDGLVYAGMVAYKYKGAMPNGTSIVLKDDCTGIAVGAFENCSGLTSVTIPNSVTEIGGSAFSGCSGLTSIVVESGNPKYDSRNNCNAIIETASNTLISGCKNTVIPNSVTSIGEYAFSGCSGLTSVTIGNSVTSIGDWAFEGCSGLTSMVVESGNTKYDSRNNCNAIIETASNTLISGCKNTVIPNSVTSIGDWAFVDCTGLTSVTIPNSVTSIGDGAFFGCSGLTSVTIGNSVTSIGGSVFYGCTGLTSVTIPNSVTSIGSSAFEGCSGLSSVTIPNSVTSIGDWAFWGCSGLTSVTIPNSVTSIGSNAFKFCSGLTLVTIPNSVTSIGAGAFEYCSGLTSVTIPNSVTWIGTGVFYGCTGLTSVTIPNSVTEIGSWDFWYCIGLTSLTLTGHGDCVFNNSAHPGLMYIIPQVKTVNVGSEITSLGEFGFTPDVVNAHASFPPTCQEGTFASYGGKLHVPSASTAAYFTAAYWQNFDDFANDLTGKVTLSRSSACMKQYSTLPLRASTTPEGCLVRWTTSNPAVARVSDEGVVTATGEGECYVFASLETDYAVYASCQVTVTPSPPFITLSNENAIIGANQLLTVYPSCTPDVPVELVVTSSDPSVAAARVVNRTNAPSQGLMSFTEKGMALDMMAALSVPSGSKTPAPAGEKAIMVVGVQNGTATITVSTADGQAEPAVLQVRVVDVDGDGHVSSVDVTAIYNYLLNGDDSAIINGDVDGDGHITSVDITAVYNLLLGN